MKSVDNLTGRELDRAVAEEVLGHTVETIYGTGDLWIEDVAAKTSHQSMSLYSELPVYSSRIEAAWEVVEATEWGDSGDFVLCHVSNSRATEWVAGEAGYDMININGPHAGADTAPLAICRAALKAVRAVEVEDD